MNIAGIAKCSFVDYPGRLAAVFFVPGCNWNCFYCHNRGLLRKQPPPGSAPPGSALVEQAFALLNSRRGLLDGVVVTGGEPTLQPGLEEFIARVRELGFPVKVDTNGSRPKVLLRLLDSGLLDYVAMDLKAPVDKYESVVGAKVDYRHINESIDLIMSSGVEYEFRTTIAPQFTHDDVLAIARRIDGAQKFVLQQFRNPVSRGERIKPLDPRLDIAPHTAEWIEPVLNIVSRHVRRCETRGFRHSTEAISAA